MLFIALFLCAITYLLIGYFIKEKRLFLIGSLLLLIFIVLFVYFVYILPENG